MLRHSWPVWEDFLSRLSIFVSNRVGQGKEQLCRDRVIQCCDRVFQGRENFCRHRGFLGRVRVEHDKKLCLTGQSRVCEGLCTRQCGAVLCRDGGGHVRRQRFGRTYDKAWAGGDSTLDKHMTRHGRIHDKDVDATEEFYRDRDFSVATDLDSDKKKKGPLGFGASQIWLNGCSNLGLQGYWEIIEELEHLRHHCLGDIAAKTAVSSSIGCLKDLQTLELNNCANLMTLPNNIGNLTGLGSLCVLNYPKL